MKLMKISMIVVSSLNNKITNGENSDISGWTSRADHDHYQNMFQNANLVIIGSNTYQAMNLGANPNKLVIVLTKNKTKYQSNFLKNQLEFSDLPPDQIIQQLEKRGYQEALVIGGATIFDLFLNRGLINYIYLTIEPKLFSKGIQLFGNLEKDYNLKLLNVKKLNKSGTLLLEYCFLN